MATTVAPYSVANFAGKGFLDVAFTEAEKTCITTTVVDNSLRDDGVVSQYLRLRGHERQDLRPVLPGFDQYELRVRLDDGILLYALRRPHRLREGNGRLYVDRFLLLRGRPLVVTLTQYVQLQLRVGSPQRRLLLPRRRQPSILWCPSVFQRERWLTEVWKNESLKSSGKENSKQITNWEKRDC
jgi:hypothetical protein